MTPDKSDITTRLRTWTHAVEAAPASDLMDEAADEIADLRATVTMDATLTSDEREAVECAAREAESHCHRERAATLRGLLDRLAKCDR